MFTEITVLFLVGVLGCVYKAIRPPPPKICGSPNGPPVTSPRIKLNDGRFISYREIGVPKEKAKHKIIVVHGFNNSKDLNLQTPQEMVEELQIYIVFYDRAGYGESDPNPKRTVKSEAFDIQELADKLGLGSKFYVIGISMGGYPTWACLKYIPHRLAGVSFVSPAVNYWWPSVPSKLSKEAFKRHLVRDQWTFRVAHYAPWLVYWWVTQKWFSSLSLIEGNMANFNYQDMDILNEISKTPDPNQDKILQQGVFESLHRDLMVLFGRWDFEPMDLANPFSHNEGSVHIWQGYEDRIVPALLQRYISDRLPWVQYHEVPNGGHLMVLDGKVFKDILRALLLGEESSIS